jgi:hypothetical protein
MIASVEDHEFNSDLLLTQRDRESAKRLFPSIFHVLDHAELRDLFLSYDEPANQAKRRGRRAGVLAIALAFGALAVASLEYPFGHRSGCSNCTFTAELLAAISALCGIAGVLIGSFGVLLARRKREWLYNRFMGERMRQFHFQSMIAQLPNISASVEDDTCQARFLADRALLLEKFKSDFVGNVDAKYFATIDEKNLCEAALINNHHALDGLGQGEIMQTFFSAYRKLRIQHQIDYANYKLADDHKIFSSHPRRQAQSFSHMSIVLIIILCIIDTSVLVSIFIPTDIIVISNREYIGLFIILVALAALATRALEQGLQPEREAERYQQYRSALRAVLDRFDRAQSVREKVQAMEEMERLSFDEMRNFLITNERAHFVM